MSLVEQAISRMRRSGSAETVEKTTPAAPVAASSAPIAAPVTPPVAERAPSARRLTVDISGLRAGGYLPEEAKDRQFAEHYRQIKRPLIQRALANEGTASGDARVIMVTSALPGDGKTFTSINLAFSLARERDISVLLVDADLPKPHVSRIFGLQKEPGLMDALVDESIAIESLVVTTNVRGLSILPAGNPAEGIAELLHSDRMRQMTARLCGQDPKRIVLLDSPPLLVTSEGPALTSLAGQVVLVVRAGQTPSRAIVESVSLIGEGRVGGIVLNEAPAQATAGYYYGYGSYGSYGDAPSPKS
jgi:protein-tyrosine kinase